MSLKVVTIDFWNTLFDSSGGTERNKFRLRTLIDETDKIGLLIKQDELESAMKSSWSYFNDVWINQHRTPSSLELVNYFWKNLKLPDNRQTINNIAAAFENSLLIHPPKIIDGVKEALEKIVQNYKLGIISDTGFSPGIVLRQLLDKEDIIKFFSAFSFSDETGVAKPEKKAFTTILDKFNCTPEDALHIGDIERTDILGAKSIGMITIRFDGDTEAYISKENPEESLADFKCNSWAYIPDIINEL